MFTREIRAHSFSKAFKEGFRQQYEEDPQRALNGLACRNVAYSAIGAGFGVGAMYEYAQAYTLYQISRGYSVRVIDITSHALTYFTNGSFNTPLGTGLDVLQLAGLVVAVGFGANSIRRYVQGFRAGRKKKPAEFGPIEDVPIQEERLA